MGFYDDDITAAQDMIAEFGAINVWTSIVVPPSSDPNNPHIPGNPVTTLHDVSIVWLPWDRESMATFTRLTGVENGDGYVYGLMGAVPFVPTVHDSIARPDGDVVRLYAIDKLAPNSQIVLWTLFAEF